jgi:hypothetical protein
MAEASPFSSKVPRLSLWNIWAGPPSWGIPIEANERGTIGLENFR